RVLCGERGARAHGDRSRRRRRNRADRLARPCRASRLAGFANRGRGRRDGAEALSLQPRRRPHPVRRDRVARVGGVERRRDAGSARRAKSDQAGPSTTKQFQAKLLGFIWFYSSESGLLNGLRRKKINKFLSP